MSNKILIFGNGEIASLAFDLFKTYTHYDISAFIIDNKKDIHSFKNKPVIDLGDIKKFSPKEYKLFIAISYQKLNLTRKEKFDYFESLGYNFVSFVHPNNNIAPNVEFGKNVFILENQTIQHDVKIGNNVMLWSSNHIGHGSQIKDHTYISSHVVISGHTVIGERCFFGVNSAVADFCKIGKNCFIGMGSNISKNIENDFVTINSSTEYYDKENKINKLIKKNYFKI